jgi:hypothetical protein
MTYTSTKVVFLDLFFYHFADFHVGIHKRRCWLQPLLQSTFKDWVIQGQNKLEAISEYFERFERKAISSSALCQADLKQED